MTYHWVYRERSECISSFSHICVGIAVARASWSHGEVASSPQQGEGEIGYTGFVKRESCVAPARKISVAFVMERAREGEVVDV